MRDHVGPVVRRLQFQRSESSENTQRTWLTEFYAEAISDMRRKFKRLPCPLRRKAGRIARRHKMSTVDARALARAALNLLNAPPRYYARAK
jgi:hypothetical protein